MCIRCAHDAVDILVFTCKCVFSVHIACVFCVNVRYENETRTHPCEVQSVDGWEGGGDLVRTSKRYDQDIRASCFFFLLNLILCLHLWGCFFSTSCTMWAIDDLFCT